MQNRHVIAIDGGKTKFSICIFSDNLTLQNKVTIKTRDPNATINKVCSIISRLLRLCEIKAIGLSLFGPLDLLKSSNTFGSTLECSDAKWSYINIPSIIHNTFRIPIFFNVDVNAGALAETSMGPGNKAADFFYLSLGTGIGGTYIAKGNFHERLELPQFGHILIPTEPDDNFPGSCIFHHNCLQGLASGKSIELRTGRPAHKLDSTDPIWDLHARYVAKACVNIIYSFSPSMIILGSSLAFAPDLKKRLHNYIKLFIGNFPKGPTLDAINSKNIIHISTLKNESSLLGAGIMAISKTGLRYGY